MLDKGKILAFVKEKGPVIPRDIVKEFGGDTFLSGAVLSQLKDAKELRLTSAKIGGTPVYYVEGQEDQLHILYNHLKEKEKEAYDILEREKILRDDHQVPAIRVALREIKDFAKALEVTRGEYKVIFWKWHLLPYEEAESSIRSLLKQEMPSKKSLEEPHNEKEEAKKQILEEKQPPIESEKTERRENLKNNSEKRDDSEEDPLLNRIKEIFRQKNVEIRNKEIIRKNTDIEMEVVVNSPVGKLNYFCKIKDKKKTNDKDLSSVFVQAQMKKLPVLYVTTGDLTNKAKDMLDEEFKIISVLYI